MRIPLLGRPSSFIPRSIPESAGHSPALAAACLEHFLARTRSTLVLTGAGISVDSNIPDYRGPSGTYTLNAAYRPIFYHEFVTRDSARRRYWARSFLGYPPVQRAKPNFTHLSLAKLTFEGRITQHITQNVTSLKSVELKEYKVDGLLHRAFQILGPESEQQPGNAILELHGSLRHVVCLYCKSKLARSQFQKDLERLNPHWAQLFSLEDRKLRLNPDGDVDVPSSLTGQSKAFEYRSFRYAACPVCNELYSDTEFLRVDSEGAWTGGTRGLVKPEVIFFGENVSDETRHQVERSIESCDQILVVGTTLAVLSAQRLVRAVKNQGKRIAIVNAGYVRDEEKLLDSNDIRIWWRTSDVFKHIESLAHLSS